MCDLNCADCVLEICEDCEDILADIDDREKELDRQNKLATSKNNSQKWYYQNRDKESDKRKKYYLENKKKENLQSYNYKLKNKEKLKQYYKDYRKKNLEAIKIKKHKYYMAHKNEISQKSRRYRQTHSEKIREYNAAYKRKICIKRRLGQISKMKSGDLIQVSVNSVNDYISELEKIGLKVIHRKDLTKGMRTRLEIV